MTMSQGIKTKINRLVTQWPKGTIGVAAYLNRLGFTHDLLTKYKKRGGLGVSP